MRTLSKINRVLESIYAPILAGAFFGITLLLTLNVILRYVFKSAFFWGEELTNYFIIWLTFVGSALCVRYGLHVSVDMILQYGSEKLKRVIMVGTTIIAILFVALLTVVGIQQCIDIVRSGQVSAAMRMPMVIPYAAIPVGGLLMLLEWVEELGRLLSPAKEAAQGTGEPPASSEREVPA